MSPPRKRPPEHLRRDEVLAILRALERPTPSARRDRMLFMLLWRTGLRISEALDLRVLDLDLDAGAIRVLHGKGDKARTVGLDKQVAEEIRRWLREEPREGLLFQTRIGGRLARTYAWQVLRDAAGRAGVMRRVHPHIFRHTYAVELVREGVPARYIQQLLGHSNLAVTTAYLASLSPEEAIDAIRERTW